MSPFIPIPHLEIVVYACLLAFATQFVRLAAWQYKLSRHLPPGPRGLPIVGNIHQMPSKNQHIVFTQWKAKYGPIVSLNLAGQPVVILNSVDTGIEFLVRRSDVHSDRPRLVMVNDIMTEHLFIALAAYGPLWRKMRRAAHEAFSVRAIEQYRAIQEREASIFARRVLANPETLLDHTKRLAASIILSVVYGWPPLDASSDALVARMNLFMHRILAATVPGAYLVEIFPVLRHLPSFMAPWKKQGQAWHRSDTELFGGFVDGVKEEIKNNSAHSSFTASLLRDMNKYGLNDKEVVWLTGTMFAVAADTTGAATEQFVYAMTLFPEVMKKAQAELDDVVGRSRLPSISDRPNLPYIEAIIKEVLRWRPVSAGGVRRTMKDDWYNGYLIPEGSIIFMNLWGMSMDPEVYPDPDTFRPERFLDTSNPRINKLFEDTHGQGHIGFGGGRRSCVGRHLANQSLFIIIARLLWATDIKGLPTDPSKPEAHDHDDEDSPLVRPKPFRCTFKPRFDNVGNFLDASS